MQLNNQINCDASLTIFDLLSSKLCSDLDKISFTLYRRPHAAVCGSPQA